MTLGKRLTFGAWHYWLMLLLTLILHAPMWLTGPGMPPWGDYYAFHSPMRILASQALHEGFMPFYTQAILGGYPVYSDPQFAFFYPVNFLFALLVPNPNGEVPLDFFILLNLIPLSLAAVFFARSFGFSRLASVVAALGLCGNGFVQMHVTHINILQVMATGYLAGGLLVRFAWSHGHRWRLALGAGLALAAGNLAGHPQTTMFLHYALGIGMLIFSWYAWRQSRDKRDVVRILGWSLVAVIAGVLIAAVQLLPTGHLLSVCARMSMGRAEAMDEAMRLQHLPSLFFPGLYVPLPWYTEAPFFRRHTFSWLSPSVIEQLTYCGVVAFSLALFGFLSNLRRLSAHLLFWSSLFLLAAAVGDQLPVYGWLYDFVPMVKAVRVPGRVLWMMYTAWGLLAAMGIDSCRTRMTAGSASQPCQGDARAGARRTLIALAGIVWIAALIVLGNYRKDWIDTALRVLIIDHLRYDDLIKENLPVFLRALRVQAIVGGVFIVLTAGWLVCIWRGRASRAATGVITVILFAEIFLYGYGRSYDVEVDAKGHVDSDAMLALPPTTTGRSLVPHFIHGGGAINSAMFTGQWLANGYSVTYPDWVRALELLDVPPFRDEYENRLLDIWNVSDIVLRKHSTRAKLAQFDVIIEDWGWKAIGTPWTEGTTETSATARGIMPSSLTIDLDDVTTPVVDIYVLATCEHTIKQPQGTPVAYMTAYGGNGSDVVTTIPMRLGIELSDARYAERAELPGVVPGHQQVPESYRRNALWEYSDQMQMYFSGFPLETTAPLSRLVFDAGSIPYPAWYAVSQVWLGLADGSLYYKAPIEFGDFREVDSGHEHYRVLRRSTEPGYAWMVPQAIRASYKKTGNIVWRMLTQPFDPRREVMVDKKRFKESKAHEQDAPSAADFRGTASVTFHRPEHITVSTDANSQGWLVMSLTYDKGWSARVDGEPVELAQANGPHMALPVSAGQHSIELTYEPVYFRLGAVVSVVTLVGVLAGMVWRRRRKVGV